MFLANETVVDAIGDAHDIDVAFDNVCAYFSQNKKYRSCYRTYFLGGRNSENEMSLYTLHFDPTLCKLDTQKISIPKGNKTTVTRIALPGSLRDRQDEYNNIITGCVNSTEFHSDMVINVSGVIRQIADIDDTVNKSISTLTVL